MPATDIKRGAEQKVRLRYLTQAISHAKRAKSPKRIYLHNNIGHICQEKRTVSTHKNTNSLLEHCATKHSKYVVYEEVQHRDNSFLFIFLFGIGFTLTKSLLIDNQ